jgi:glycerate 2-kinase
MILVAPTAFKGTVSARAAAAAMADGVRALGIDEVIELPLSDGGPGLIDALSGGSDRLELIAVEGPMGGRADVRLLWRDRTAIIETADACGLHLVPRQARNPLRATTRGVGQAIAAALEGGARKVVLGLGGSATVDGGVGMAAALGWRFLDRGGRSLERIPADLAQLMRVEPPPHRTSAQFIGLADVRTPLVGPEGAARVFGPQKGATPEMVELLDRLLVHLAGVIALDLGVEDIASTAGTGAAGGLGAAVRAFLNGELRSGSAWVLEHVGFDELLARASLVITGEGSFDAQSALGKVTGVVIDRAATFGKPVLLVAGAVAGAVPPHVQVVHRNGAILSEQDLRTLTQQAASRLLPL